MRQDSDTPVVAPMRAPIAPPRPALAYVDGQAVNAGLQADAVEQAMRRVRAGYGFTLFTLNLDHLVKRREHAGFRAAYARADIVTADGQPVVQLARRDGAQLERTTGADLVLPLCAAAEADGAPIFLFGATGDSLEAARAELLNRFPDLDVRGCESPPMGFDPSSDAALEAGRRIAASGARLCFVALGAPKQELFADRIAHSVGGVGYVCVGAALDFISGDQRRAPAVFQRTGLEWVYRLATNPARMWRRYARCALLYARLRLAGAGSAHGGLAGRPSPA